MNTNSACQLLNRVAASANRCQQMRQLRTTKGSRPAAKNEEKVGGFTLIETLVAMTFGASIMLTAVTLVHTAFQYQSQTQMRIEHASKMVRFVEQFRRDVHWASHIELTNQQVLTLSHANQEQVVYRLDQNKLIRQSKDHDHVLQVEQIEIEPQWSVRFTMGESQRWVVLEIGSVESLTNRPVERQVLVARGSMEQT